MKNEHGFTLIETLVVMNLLFLVVSSALGIYLLVNRFAGGIQKKASARAEYTVYLNALTEKLSDCRKIYIAGGIDSAWLYNDKEIVLKCSGRQLKYYNDSLLTIPDSTMIEIVLADGQAETIKNGCRAAVVTEHTTLQSRYPMPIKSIYGCIYYQGLVLSWGYSQSSFARSQVTNVGID